MTACEICDGVGLVPTERGSKPCSCQSRQGQQIRLGKVGIPAEFAGATLAGFRPCPHTQKALALARHYLAEYIPGQTKTGLIFTGSTGTGKTHLAAGLARELAEQKGVETRFVDVNALLDRLRIADFDKAPSETREGILAPIHAAELVVLDDLGATRSNDWVFDTLQGLIGRFYNSQKPTIITTNLLNEPFNAQARIPTLGERIGERMFSRLQQMCRAIDMTGPDWRRKLND